MIEEPKMCFISYTVGVIYSFFMTLICSPLPQYFIIVFCLFFVSLFLFICLFVFFLSFFHSSFFPSFLPSFLPSFIYLIFIYLFIYYLLFLFLLYFTFILPVKSGLVYRITQWRLWVTQEPEDCIMNWSRQSA